MTDFALTEEQIEQARVVVVDDDQLVTSSLSSFLNLEVEIDPITFNDSRNAASYVRDNEIDLIISDFLMPEMNGIDLLIEVRRLRPEVPRVLLTGYADKENAIRAINEARVFQYLEKPWDNEHLREIVLAALERAMVGRKLGEVPELSEMGQTLKRTLH